MKISQVKEVLNSVFEEDDALKYALATNIAKYGRPQSKPSDKPAKLTKGLEKKREKAVKDLKKVMDEQEGSPFPGPDMNNKGYIAARDLIDRLRATVFKKLNDDELEEFRKTLANAFDFNLKERVVSDNESPSLKAKIAAEDFMRGYRTTLRRVDGNFGKEAAEEFKTIVKSKMAQIQEGLNEDEGTLNKIADMLSRKFDDLDFDVNTARDRIDVRGSRYDLAEFGEELHGEKIFDYEVFYIEEDPGERGAIVRIVKSDSIMREEQTMQGNPNLRMGTYAGRKVIVNTMGTEDISKWKAVFLNTGKRVDFADVAANIKLDEKAKKADRCLRIARRKMPQSSAYRSGLIVKCRKGMIWKKEK